MYSNIKNKLNLTKEDFLEWGCFLVDGRCDYLGYGSPGWKLYLKNTDYSLVVTPQWLMWIHNKYTSASLEDIITSDTENIPDVILFNLNVFR